MRGRTLTQMEWMAERRLRSIERGDWDQLSEERARKGLPPPFGILEVGGSSPVKDKFALGFGQAGQLSGWDIPDLVEYDYSLGNIAGASTVPGMIIGFMPSTNNAALGSVDGLDAPTTAIIGNRQIGTGSSIYAIVLSCYIFARTSAGAVYAPGAGSTMRLIAASLTGSTQATDNLTPLQTLSGLTNFWTQQVITGPAGRTFSLSGTVASVATCYWGDALFSQLVTTGVLNIQGNTLSMILEMS